MELVDLRHLRDLLGIAAVVRQRVVRIGDADLRIGAIAGLARELERDDARDVALQREHLQVEHQLRVIGIRGRHADRTIEIGQRVVDASAPRPSGCGVPLRARCRDTQSTFARSAGAELPLQPRDVFAYPVEQARPACRAPRGDPPSCRPRQTAARTRRADALRTAAASSATTTTDCSGRRRRSRCRTAPPPPSDPSPVRATAAASPAPSAARRSDRRSCRDSSRCSRSTSPSRR